MRSRLLLLGILLPLIGGCGEDEDETRHPASLAGLSTDRQIYAYVLAVTQGELNIAQVAFGRVQLPEVRALADQVVAGNTQGLIAVQAASGTTPLGSPEVNQLIQVIIADVEMLRVAEGAVVDVTWICETLGGQLAVLNVIDTQLVPNAMDPRIVAIVQQFRADLLAKQAVFQALARTLTIQFDTLGPTGFRCGIALPQVP